MTRLPLAALALLAVAPAAQAQDMPAPTGKSTSIPFITHGSVRTFDSSPDGAGLYIQNARRDWYYVSFFTRCQNLPYALRIGFDTFGNGTSLQRGDTIFADRERCRIADIVASGPPPRKAKKPKKARHG